MHCSSCSSFPTSLAGLGELSVSQYATIQSLADAYDRAQSDLSFADWAGPQYAALLADFRTFLRTNGDVEALAAIDAVPPPTEAGNLEKWDAPTTPGPWALNASGEWFKVTKMAPGSSVGTYNGRQIYVPAEHPSTHVKEDNYGAGTQHMLRFTDQKFRAANKATLKSLYDLFFRIAPRGGWGADGQGFGYAFDGTPEDYNFEGGLLYPDLQGGTVAQRLADWYGNHSFDNKYGYDRGLTLNWLRVYTDSDGYRRYKPWTTAEAQDFANRWHMAAPGYVCRAGEVFEVANDTINRQAERQRGQPEKDYSVHWVWPIGPLSQCSPTSSSRRRSLLKKVAIIGGIVAGAVFLGPMIASALHGGAAAGAGAAAAGSGATGAAVTGAAALAPGAGVLLPGVTLATAGTAAAATGIGVLGTTGIIGAATTLVPQILKAVNTGQTMQAVLNGQVPPPPVNVGGSDFTEWATSIAMTAIEQKGYQMTQAQRDEAEATVRAEVQRQQALAIANGLNTYPTQSMVVNPAVNQVADQAAAEKEQLVKYSLFGLAGLAALYVLTQ